MTKKNTCCKEGLLKLFCLLLFLLIAACGGDGDVAVENIGDNNGEGSTTLLVSWEDQFSMDSLNIDSDGWSNLTPSSDSRLMFVSSSEGDDATGQIYSPAEVGGDPHNPTGIINTFKSIDAAILNARTGYPDWVILKRGDEWNRDVPHDDSILSYWDPDNGNDDTGQIYSPSDSEIGADPLNPTGTVNAFATHNGSTRGLRNQRQDWLIRKSDGKWGRSMQIDMISGRSISERAVLTYYGDTNAPRPFLKTGTGTGIRFWINKQYIAVMGLSFYSHKRDPNSADFAEFDNVGSNSGFTAYTPEDETEPNSHILIEDCAFNFYGGNGLTGPGQTQDIILRRNQFLNNYSKSSHSQGLYTNGASVYLEENLFDHNGWFKQSYVRLNDQSEGQATYYNHNTYFTNTSNTIFRNNLFLRASSIGTKFTANPKNGVDEIMVRNVLIENNFYFEGELGMSIGGNTDYDEGFRWSDMKIVNNVITELGRSQPTNRNLGWGIEVKDWDGGIVSGNYLVNYGNNTVTNTFGIDVNGHNRNVDINDNILSNIAGSGYAVRLRGVYPKDNVRIFDNEIQLAGTNTLLVRSSFPDLDTFSNNIYDAERSADSWFRLNDVNVSFDDWVVGSGDSSTSRTALNYTNSNVSLASYNASLGGAATAEAFIESAKGQSRFNWSSNYTANAVNNYFRAGFVVE